MRAVQFVFSSNFSHRHRAINSFCTCSMLWKKKFVEDSIDWLRNNDVGMLNAVDDNTAEAFAKLAGIPYEGRPLPSHEKSAEQWKMH